MNVLALVHGEGAGAELFAPVVAEAGHRLDEWSFASSEPPPQPLDEYDAVLVFGGSMHPDQDAAHPWLEDELAWLRELPAPTLGICLGSQLLARAAGASVGPLPEPEIGWHEVELAPAAESDPLLSTLPSRFTAFEWHHYGHALPEGAVELARSPASLQAFRLGDACWGVQFHPEVTEPQLARWIRDKGDPPSDPERLLAETREWIGSWNELGRRLCRAFLATAEETRFTRRASTTPRVPPAR